jgi:hypothetical protein
VKEKAAGRARWVVAVASVEADGTTRGECASGTSRGDAATRAEALATAASVETTVAASAGGSER